MDLLRTTGSSLLVDCGQEWQTRCDVVDAGGDSMRLKDKVAIITGAAQGIGREYALRFAEEGAKVALIDTRYDQAKAVEQEITAKNGQAMAVTADVTKEGELVA